MAHWLEGILAILCDLFRTGETFVIDSMPVPYCGYCAAKKEKFFGWRLHLICTPDGIPVVFDMLPGALHDLTPIHELTVNLPPGATVLGDKGYNDAPGEASILRDTGVRLIPIRKKNMKPNAWVDDYDLRLYRHGVETTNSQLDSMGINCLHARTNAGFEIKVHASLLALTFANLN